MQKRVHDRELLDSLESFSSERIQRSVWRVTREGREPLQGAAGGGRWSPPEIQSAIYASSERLAALSEVYFHLSKEPVFPSRLRFRAHEVAIDLPAVLNLSMPGRLETLGINEKSYQSLDYTATHEVAAAAFFLELNGIWSPSARFEADNLCVFLNNTAPHQLEIMNSVVVDWDEVR